MHLVLDIPLTRLHICTLHTLCIVVEKLIYFNINFSLKENDKKLHTTTIQKLDKILSSIELCSGNVKIVLDTKQSTSTHEVPIKPSIGGVEYCGFLSVHNAIKSM